MTTPAMVKRLTDIAEVLKLFPEVDWDRTAAAGSSRVVFGWIEREDDHADFVLLEFTASGRVGMTTSSARYSLEFHIRLTGTDAGHSACRRVEDVFAGLEVRAIELEAADG